jgi:hypothetical protein
MEYFLEPEAAAVSHHDFSSRPPQQQEASLNVYFGG